MKIKTALPVTILIMLAVLAGSAPAVQIVTGPYLQAPSETTMTVMWMTDRPCTSWVKFGRGNSFDRTTFHSRHGLIDADQTIHRVTLENLAPGTSYQYRVSSREITTFEPYKVVYGDTVHSETYTFTTLNSKKDAFSFVVLNDIHERNAILVSLMQRAALQPYDLVVLNGDILGHIENEPQIVEHVLKPCTDLFASHTPFVYVRGNHETRGRFARRLPEYVALPNDRYYYAFDHGPIRFIVLDSGEDKYDHSKEYSGLVDFDRYRDIQQEWLRREIQSEAFRTAPFRVVLVHMPPQPSEHWHGPMDIYNKWRPLLNQGRIDLMISGHTHRYTVEMPQPGVRRYPRVIGGAPKAGEATLIRVDATPETLDVTMTRDDGCVVGTCRIRSQR